MEVVNSRTIIHPTDLARSLEFYGSKLGLAVAREFGSGAFRGVVYFLGGGFIEISGHRDRGGGSPDGPTDRAVAAGSRCRGDGGRAVPSGRAHRPGPRARAMGSHRGVDR